MIVNEISGLEVGESGIERTEILNKGQSSLEFTINTTTNNIDETTKRILVQLKPVSPPSNYSLGIKNTAEIGILDSDLPELSISGGDAIIEGNSAQFTIVSDIARDSDLSIEYTVSTGDSNFLSLDQPDRASIILSAGSAEDHLELFIETVLDSVDEADGEVVVTLQDDSNAIPTYRVSESLNHATVMIQDLSIPLISISGSDTIEEGADAEYTITANITREQDLQIQYSVSDGSSNFLLESQVEIGEVVLAAGEISETKTILISTESDNIDEHNGQISVSLLPDDEVQPSYLIDLLQSTATVLVTDDDVPVISIASSNSIDEGEVATFTISADIDRDTDLEIKYIINDSAENSVDPTFASEGIIQFRSESSEVSILVPTINDLVDRLNGNVTISLVPNDENSEQYQINSNLQQAVIQVRDNDVPEISLVGIGLTSDFHQAEFEVSSDIASEKNQTISYRVDFFQGEILDQTQSREDSVTLQAGQSNRATAFTIARPENEEIGEYTSILVTLLNDPQSIATYQISARRGVSRVSIIEEDPQGTLPIISIATVEGIVIEGSDAVFEVTVDRAIAENLFVNYTVRENQTDFLAPEVARDGIVSLKPNESVQTTAIIVQTENDLVDETTGKIEIILESEQSFTRNYFVSVLRGKASVVIEDDDQPVISVTGTELIVEGENAEFVFSADIARDHDLSIDYRINSGKSNFISNSQATTGIITLNAGNVEETSTLFVSTIDDFVDENSGEIVVTIQRDTEFPVTYSISPASNRESLTVLDNDIPELTISGGDAVYEGDSAQFSITSNIARENNIRVNYEITDNTSDFLQSFVRTGQVELLAGPADLSTLLYISTINDSNNQQTGIIEVALRPDTISPAKYTIVENNKTASVVVQDDDIPVISIIGNQLVTEGDSINLLVSADIGRRNDLTIGYQILGDTAQFMSPSQPEVGTISLPAGEASITANLTIATVQDTRDEIDGTIVINLQPDSALPQTYELSSTQDNVQVSVQDDDVPIISITAGESIVESENAEFTIQSNSILDSNISVNYSVSDGLSSFLSLTHASTGSIELGTNQTSTSTVLSIPTIGDFVDELDGSITVSILPDTNIPPLYEIDTQNGQTIVSVHDDDIPLVHIASLNDIVEGQVAVFYLWTDIAREQDLQVNYLLDSADGDFIDPTQYREEQITLAAGASLLSSIFPVSTLDDENEEENGSISVTLQADNQAGQIYNIYPGDNLASVKVFDDDSIILLPEISVVSSTNSIQEGENAEFSITSDLPLSENLLVQYTISDGSGNFLPQDIIYSEVELTASLANATESVVVPTLADFVDEQNGQIILTLTLDSGDSPSYTINPEYGFGITDIEDDDKPALSITGGEPIIEGATAQFTISSTVSRESRLPINYEVSNENGNFLSEIQLSVGEIYLEAWETETIINVSTIQDDVDEANGEILVRLLPSSATPTDYTIEVDAQSSAVLVSDDDLPEISISGLGSVTEGENAEFVVKSNIARNQNIDITYTIIDRSGQYLLDPQTVIDSITLESGDKTASATITIATEADEVDEVDGEVIVTLQPDNPSPVHYLVNESEKTGRVALIDDDMPVISVSSQGSATEQSGIFFTFSSNIERDHPIRIRFNLEDGGGEVLNRLAFNSFSTSFATNFRQTMTSQTTSTSSSVLLGAGGSDITTTVFVPAEQDNTDELFDQITLTIQPDEAYSRSDQAGSQTVIVEDDDVPIISIIGGGTVTESENAIFTIGADIAREQNITVFYSVSSGLFETTKSSIELSAGSSNTVAVVSIDVPDNEIFESLNYITVELLDDVSARYHVDPSQNEDTIVVLDNDIPKISIEGEVAVTEGDYARFVVSADIVREENLIIRYNVSNYSGDFLSPRQPRSDTVVFGAGTANDTKEILVETHNDTYLENDGEIQVTLVAGDNRTNKYTIDSLKNSAIVTVRDDGDTDRQTQVNLSLSSSVTEINEGGTIPITITSDIDPISSILVSYSINNTDGNFYTISNGSSIETKFMTLEFSESLDSGNFEASLLIETRAVNQLDEDHGTITISLNTTADYDISPFEPNSVAIKVYDLDIPELSIQASTSVTTPEMAIIDVYSDIEPWQPLTIEFTPNNQIGNFLDTTAGNSGISRTAELIFSESTTSNTWFAQLSILTIEDESLDNGSFVVTLEPEDSIDQSSYTINTSANQSTVYASNLPTTYLHFVEERITVAEDDETVTFTIASTLNESQILSVKFIPTNITGNFLDVTNGLSGEVREVELTFDLAESSLLGEYETETENAEDTSLDLVENTSLYTAKMTIPLSDPNGVDEEDGMINVELVESLGYSIEPSQTSTVEILVEDVDVPELSLPSSIETIAGGVIYIPITSDIEIRKTLNVNYVATNDIGDFLDENEGQSGSTRTVSLEFTPLEISTTYFANFPLNINYSDDFASGQITIELRTNIENSLTTYTIDESASSTTIKVTRGSMPELAIIDSRITVNEGDAVAEVTIEANIDPERALWVTYTPENTIGDFLAVLEENSETSQVEILQFTFNSDQSILTSTIDVMLRNINGLDEEDGTILVTLDTPTREAGYTVSETRNESVITIKDIDEEPYINIADVSDSETVEQFLFQVTLTQASRKDISVDYESSSITAQKNIDFENIFGTLRIPAGQISTVISVNIIQDRETEFEEYFSITLSNPENAQLYKFIAVGVIRENEKWEVSISTVKDQIVEGEDALIVVSTNQPVTDEPLTVLIGVSQIGDVIKWRVKRFVRVTGTEYIYNIATKDNILVDPDKSILVKLIPGKDYDIKAGANQVVVEVIENENRNQDPGLRISPSSLVANTVLHRLSNIPSFTENQGPFINISAIEPVVNEGSPARFEVRTQNTLNERIEVNLDVQGSVGLYDRDLITKVTLNENNPIMIYEVNTIYDNQIEDDEILKVTVVAGENYRIGKSANASVTITDIDDRKNAQQELVSGQQSILPEILGFISNRALDEISNRKNLTSSSQNNFAFNFGGKTAITDMIKEGGELINKDSTSWQELLDDSRIQLNLSPGTTTETSATIWGIGDYQELTSNFSEVETSWNGDLFNGLVGVDTTISEGLIAGLAVSAVQSSFDYQLTNELALKIASNIFGLNPYINWQSQDQATKFSAFVGFGLGELDLALPDFGNHQVNNQSYSFGLSGSNRLHVTENNVSNISNELELVGETWFADQSINTIDNILNAAQINSGRFRVYGKNSTQFGSESGATLNPIFNLGVRGDNKNNQSIFGIEFDSELNYSNKVGFSIEGKNNFYMTQLDQIHRWDLEGAFKFDHGNDKLGILLEVNPYWRISHNPDQVKFWNSDLLTTGLENEQNTKSSQIISELGFGFSIADGLGIFTPFSGIEVTEFDRGKRYLGARVSIGSNLRFEVEGSDTNDSNGIGKQNLELNGIFNW